MSASRLSASLTLFGLACAPAAERPAPLAPAPLPRTLEAPGGRAEPDEPQAEAPTTDGAEVREPASVACRIGAKEWSFSQLRLSAGGEPFASVTRAPVTVVFGVETPPKSAIAVLDDGSLLMRLVARDTEARLFTRAATPLAGFLIPEASQGLRWLGGEPGKLRVGLDASALLVSPERVDDSLGCEALAVTEPSFTARDSVTKTKTLPKLSVARDAAELSTAPGGAVAARVQSGMEVEVLGRKGTDTRVLLSGPGYLVVGWMATRDLSTKAPSAGGFGIGYGTGSGARAGRQSGFRCPHDLELWGELGGERARVGTLRKDTAFLTKPEGEIELLTRWLWLRKEARLLALPEALKGCEATTVTY